MKRLGCYVKTKACACGWAADFAPLAQARECCPDCGGELKETVGRFVFEESGWGWWRRDEIIGFRAKDTPAECDANVDGKHHFESQRPKGAWAGHNGPPPKCACGLVVAKPQR